MLKHTKIAIGLATLIAGWLLLEPAQQYGALWDSQTHPVEAKVTLRDGQEISGLLFKSWDDRFRLATTNGPEIEFKDYERINITTPVQNTGFFERWRAYMPTLLVTTLLMITGLYLVLALQRLTWSWRNLDTPNEGQS